jgi:hypothetical protein
MTKYDLGISTVKQSTLFPLWGTTNCLIRGIKCYPQQLFVTLYSLQSAVCSLQSRAVQMAASSNERKKDLLTEEDISKGLNK